MRIGIGIAAGIVGFVLYGAFYYAAFSYAFDSFDLAIRMVALGMLLSGASYLVGFHMLDDDGIVLFAKALALPLIGIAVLLIGMGAIVLISNIIPDVFVVGIGAGLYKLYDWVNMIFFPL
jgi:hypothetical protein